MKDLGSELDPPWIKTKYFSFKRKYIDYTFTNKLEDDVDDLSAVSVDSCHGHGQRFLASRVGGLYSCTFFLVVTVHVRSVHIPLLSITKKGIYRQPVSL